MFFIGQASQGSSGPEVTILERFFEPSTWAFAMLLLTMYGIYKGGTVLGKYLIDRMIHPISTALEKICCAVEKLEETQGRNINCLLLVLQKVGLGDEAEKVAAGRKDGGIKP